MFLFLFRYIRFRTFYSYNKDHSIRKYVEKYLGLSMLTLWTLQIRDRNLTMLILGSCSARLTMHIVYNYNILSFSNGIYYIGRYYRHDQVFTLCYRCWRNSHLTRPGCANNIVGNRAKGIVVLRDRRATTTTYAIISLTTNTRNTVLYTVYNTTTTCNVYLVPILY